MNLHTFFAILRNNSSKKYRSKKLHMSPLHWMKIIQTNTLNCLYQLYRTDQPSEVIFIAETIIVLNIFNFSRVFICIFISAKPRVPIKRKSPEILNTQMKKTVNKYGYLRDIHSNHLNKKQKLVNVKTEIGTYYKIWQKFHEDL